MSGVSEVPAKLLLVLPEGFEKDVEGGRGLRKRSFKNNKQLVKI